MKLLSLSFTITETGNAAFAEDGGGGFREAARILRQLAVKLERGTEMTEGPLRDANGNRVGDWQIEVEEEDDGAEVSEL